MCVHREALEELQQPNIRRMYRQWLFGARGSASREPRAGQFARPAVEFVRPRGRPDDPTPDPIPVVRGEILAPQLPAQAAGRLVQILDRNGFTPDPPDSRRRFVPSAPGAGPDPAPNPQGPPSPLERALRAVEDDPDPALRADPNHVYPLAWTMKGGDATVALTETAPTAQSPGDGEPLVVVIDTGLYGAAGQRTDGFLDRATMHTGDDEDLLDVLNWDGDVVPSGRGDGSLDLGAGHGTFVSGIVARVAPRARIVVLKALATDGAGTDTQLADAIRRAATVFDGNGGRGVLNLSLGSHTHNDETPVVIEEALAALPSGVAVVAAAGNWGTDREVFPAAADGVHAVAGLDEQLQTTKWSSRGGWVDFSTVGECVASTFVPGTETEGKGPPHDPYTTEAETFPEQNPYGVWSGTSFAAPQVAAWLAAHLAAHPDDGPDEAVTALKGDRDPLPNHGIPVRLL